MRHSIHFFKNLIFFFFVFTLLTAGFCTKEGVDDDEDEESVTEETVRLIDTTKPYVILNVTNPQAAGTVRFPTPADNEFRFTPDYPNYSYGKIGLSQSGDTVRTYWLFTPDREKTIPELPAWQFCNTTPYEPYIQNGFLVRSTWFRSTLGSNLKEAYRYNLNIRDRRSTETYGSAQYWQYDYRTSTYPQNISTSYILAAAGTDPYSWIEYTKIENKVAAGRFRFWFACSNGGTEKTTEVLGLFGNIPLE